MQKTLETILNGARSATLTPVGKAEDAPSRIDYNRETDHYLMGITPMWDDSNTNDSRIGDLFVFVEGHAQPRTVVGDGRVQIHKIIGIKYEFDENGYNLARPQYWKIPAHRNRKVLILSDIVYEGTWVEFCDTMGRQNYGKNINGVKHNLPLQGTKRWKIA